jgi:hypothetical protein
LEIEHKSLKASRGIQSSTALHYRLKMIKKAFKYHNIFFELQSQFLEIFVLVHFTLQKKIPHDEFVEFFNNFGETSEQ